MMRVWLWTPSCPLCYCFGAHSALWMVIDLHGHQPKLGRGCKLMLLIAARLKAIGAASVLGD